MNPYESPKHYDDQPGSGIDMTEYAAAIGKGCLEGVVASVVILILLPAWITWEAMDKKWRHPANLLGLCLCPVWWFFEITFLLTLFGMFDTMLSFAWKLLS